MATNSKYTLTSLGVEVRIKGLLYSMSDFAAVGKEVVVELEALLIVKELPNPLIGHHTNVKLD
jgi:hypothetical protein